MKQKRRKDIGKKPQLSDFTLREKIGQTCQMQSGFLMNMGDKLEDYLKENPIGNIWHTCNTAMVTVNLADLEIDEPQDSTYYREWVKRYAKALNIPLEINFLGIAENRHYPNPFFWQIAAEEGCNVIFGIDAHKPEAFAFENTLQKAQSIVDRYQLRLLENVAFRNPFC